MCSRTSIVNLYIVGILYGGGVVCRLGMQIGCLVRSDGTFYDKSFLSKTWK